MIAPGRAARDLQIDQAVAHPVAPDRLALVGFSQGTMMALHIGLRRPRKVAAVVGYSGMLTATTGLAHADIPKPPVLLVHGTADPVVPIAAMHMAQSELGRLGVEVTTHTSYGIAHSVDPVGLRLGRDFVAKRIWALPRKRGERFGKRLKTIEIRESAERDLGAKDAATRWRNLCA